MMASQGYALSFYKNMMQFFLPKVHLNIAWEVFRFPIRVLACKIVLSSTSHDNVALPVTFSRTDWPRAETKCDFHRLEQCNQMMLLI